MRGRVTVPTLRGVGNRLPRRTGRGTASLTENQASAWAGGMTEHGRLGQRPAVRESERRGKQGQGQRAREHRTQTPRAPPIKLPARGPAPAPCWPDCACVALPTVPPSPETGCVRTALPSSQCARAAAAPPPFPRRSEPESAGRWRRHSSPSPSRYGPGGPGGGAGVRGARRAARRG